MSLYFNIKHVCPQHPQLLLGIWSAELVRAGSDPGLKLCGKIENNLKLNHSHMISVTAESTKKCHLINFFVLRTGMALTISETMFSKKTRNLQWLPWFHLFFTDFPFLCWWATQNICQQAPSERRGTLNPIFWVITCVWYYFCLIIWST